MIGGMRLVRAALRKPVDRTPVWFMRQAGRYLPAYRKLREKHSILEICKDPDLAARATLAPIEAFPALDAAIIFSDILLVLEPMGIEIEYTRNGPVIRNPVRDRAGVDALRPLDPSRDLLPMLNAVSIVRSKLPKETALIGFAGGPFTLASYLVKGGPSKNYLAVKGMMYQAPKLWNRLMSKLAGAVIDLLKAQVDAGADVLQVFDSWIGVLTPSDYREYVLPHSKRIFDALKGRNVPVIHFAADAGGLLESMKAAGGDVISIDWRIPLDVARRRLGNDVALQGNLDPAAMTAPRAELLRRVDQVLEAAGDGPGHIFNLGHGILPPTPPDHVAAVIDHVHRRTAR